MSEFKIKKKNITVPKKIQAQPKKKEYWEYLLEEPNNGIKNETIAKNTAKSRILNGYKDERIK